MPNTTTRRPAIPSLTLPGAAVLSGALLILSLASAHAVWLSVLTAALSGALFTVLVLFHRSPLTAITPVLCVAVIVLSASGFAGITAACLFLPMGVSAAYAIRRQKSRMAVITVISVSAGITAAAYTAVLLAVRRITPSDFLASARADAIRYLTSRTVLTADAGLMPLFTEESASALVTYITLLAPALLGCTLFLLSYASTAIIKAMLTRMEADALFFTDDWQMRPTKGMAAVYTGAQLLTLLFAALPDTKPLYYAAYNLSLIFLLPLAFLGSTTLIFHIRRTESLGILSRLALIILTLMIAAAGLYWLLTFAAFYGIYIVFRQKNVSP